MNFFEQQDHARRQTRTLVILFALAVLCIVVAVNLAMALVWSLTQSGYVPGMRTYPKGFFATNTAITLALIAGGTLIEMFNLRDGGDAVAKMAGGRLVAPSSTDLQERRLLNVVEEMALASGIACPKVYLLDGEDAINAFAAGYNPNEAVVAVTRGALARLTRDELQGVIGHEFSHIFNGDMRLNVRLIGLLFCIQMIAGFGQHLIDFGAHTWGSRDREGKGPSARMVLLATGVALFVIGYIGIFFGRLIKAAVSRQREFLADASAVQFTRNPDGIGGALRKIGGLSQTMQLGSRIRHPNAEQLSHLFLGAPRVNLLSGMFATHPPLEERLRRIYGRDVELLPAPEQPSTEAPSERLPDIPYSVAALNAEAGQGHWITFGNHVAPQALPAELDSAAREPQAATSIVHALLLGEGEERDTQLALLGPLAAMADFLAKAISRLPKSARLPLLDLAMPALKQLHEAQRAELLAMADKLIAADNKLTLPEFVLQTVLVRRLGAHAGRATPVRFANLSELKDDCVVLLSLVAHVAAVAQNAVAEDMFAAGVARLPAAFPPVTLKAVGEIDYARVSAALDNAQQLAPLAKPLLIKALLAATGNTNPMPLTTADLLRAICAALDAPIPPAVAATYTDYHWQS